MVQAKSSSPSSTTSTFRNFVVPRYHDVRPKFYVPRNEISPALLAAEADNGWDSYNAVRVPLVNAAILESDVSPKDFRYEEDGIVIEGNFGVWTITHGGSGSIVFMQAPITSAQCDLGPFSETFPNFEFSNGSVTFQVKLNYINEAPTKSIKTDLKNDTGEPKYLVTRTQSNTPKPVVVIQYIDYGNTTPDNTSGMLFNGFLETWFNENIELFNYIFSVVNINSLAASEEFQWLKPTYTSYAYYGSEETSLDSCCFGVLNMIDNNSPTGLANQIPPSAIPDGSDASIVISNKMFLQHMVFDGLPSVFGVSENSFVITGNDTQIELAVDEISLEGIEVEDDTYTPVLEVFRLQILGDEIQINFLARTDAMSNGVHVYVEGTSYYKIKLVNKPDGSQTIDFEESRPGEYHDWYEKEVWVEILAGVLALIGSIAAVVTGSLVNSVARRIISTVIILIVTALVSAIPALIASVMAGNAAEAMPSIDKLVIDASNHVEWPSSSGFILTSAELNGGLQLGGYLEGLEGVTTAKND